MLIIKIHNDGTGSNQSANYNYGVYINDRRIANGRIEGHNRNDGWQKLVSHLIKPLHDEQANICPECKGRQDRPPNQC